MDWEVLHRHTMGVDQWGTRGTLTTPRPKGVSRGSVLIFFQFITQIHRHIEVYSNIDHSPLLKPYIGLVVKFIIRNKLPTT